MIAVDPEHTDAVVATLADRGTAVAVVGSVEQGSGVSLDGEAVPAPSRDSSWPVYERLLAAEDDQE